MPGPGGSGRGQELLDHHLGLAVLALAEVVMPDLPLRVGEVEGGPVVVIERAPDRIVVIGRDGIVDAHFPHRPADVADVVLDAELGRVDADHHQSLAGVPLAQART